MKPFLFIQLLLICKLSISQKLSHILIHVPPTIDTGLIIIKFDDGITTTKVKPVFKNGEAEVEAKFISHYATLEFEYPKSKNNFYYNAFWAKEGKSAIRFIAQGDTNSPIENALLKNAVEIKNTILAKKLNSVLSEDYFEIEKLQKLIQEHNNVDSLRRLLNKRYNLADQKTLSFIVDNKNYYYSFWLFRKEVIANLLGKDVGKILAAYKSFPKSTRVSVEGKNLFAKLNGFLHTRNGVRAPTFVSFDTRGEKIKLTDFKGKYVLLQFWASWCGPCLEEIPMLRKIHEIYSSSGKLSIIGISLDHDFDAFLKAKNNNEMKWIQIFNNPEIRRLYGDKPIPQLYLINSNGIIVYNNMQNTIAELIKQLDSL